MKPAYFTTTHGNTTISQNGEVVNSDGFGLGGWMNEDPRPHTHVPYSRAIPWLGMALLLHPLSP
jgi:hypothetical protein